MNEKLKEKIKESLSSVLPITVIVLLLSITLVPLEVGTLTLFLTGAVLLIVGIGLFQLGAEMAMTPLGQGVGSKLSKGEANFPHHPHLFCNRGDYHHRGAGSAGTGKSGGLYSQPGTDLDSGNRRWGVPRRSRAAHSLPYQPAPAAGSMLHPVICSFLFFTVQLYLSGLLTLAASLPVP